MSTTVYDLERTVNSDLTTAVKISKINFGQLFIEIDIEFLYSTILYLKTNNKCRFKQLIDITAVDYPEKEKRFKLVYLLLSHENNLRVSINLNINETTHNNDNITYHDNSITSHSNININIDIILINTCVY